MANPSDRRNVSELHSNSNEQASARPDYYNPFGRKEQPAHDGAIHEPRQADGESNAMNVIRRTDFDDDGGIDDALHAGSRRRPRASAPSDAIALRPDDGSVPVFKLEEMHTEFDREDGIYWCYQQHTDHPSFTPGLLRDVRKIQDSLEHRYGGTSANQCPIKYLVWGSQRTDIFNLGGDLRLISRLIADGDESSLRRYAEACIDICFPNYRRLGMPVITVALVQGDALGGGFEAALSSDVLVAERGANLGLPEILFNLFPGMGAFSFLGRKIGPGPAEKMLLSGTIYTAEQLHEMGVVDILANEGSGEEALLDHIRKNGRQHNAQRSIFKVRDRFAPLTRDELIDITEIWVEAALNLTDSDLRRIDRLVRAQKRRVPA
jgi:DSF synthase